MSGPTKKDRILKKVLRDGNAREFDMRTLRRMTVSELKRFLEPEFKKQCKHQLRERGFRDEDFKGKNGQQLEQMLRDFAQKPTGTLYVGPRPKRAVLRRNRKHILTDTLEITREALLEMLRKAGVEFGPVSQFQLQLQEEPPQVLGAFDILLLSAVHLPAEHQTIYLKPQEEE